MAGCPLTEVGGSCVLDAVGTRSLWRSKSPVISHVSVLCEVYVHYLAPKPLQMQRRCAERP